MIAKPINLQDGFLNQVRKENAQVIIYLINGFQLRGLVKGFDNFTLILENEGKPHLVYKHAISTITPSQAMPNFFQRPAAPIAPVENTASAREEAPLETPNQE